MASRIRATDAIGSRFALLAFATLVVASGLACAGDAPKEVIEPVELVARLGNGTAPLILDVRTEKEYAAGHIPGAVNISHDELAQRIGELPEDKRTEIVVHCQSGRRAGIAESLLRENGFTRVRDLAGHWKAWSSNERPME
ncbi:MAG: rhodanese-like domain-containing protein [Myxococcota bacterium]|jgi:rhodanese-related sulfurtransferase|nr:rhodanese-like domain-containing protein [Myxococcota bacterium]